MTLATTFWISWLSFGLGWTWLAVRISMVGFPQHPVPWIWPVLFIVGALAGPINVGFSVKIDDGDGSFEFYFFGVKIR